MFLVPPIDGLDVLVPLLKRFRFQISAEHRGRPEYGRHRAQNSRPSDGMLCSCSSFSCLLRMHLATLACHVRKLLKTQSLIERRRAGDVGRACRRPADARILATVKSWLGPAVYL